MNADGASSMRLEVEATPPSPFLSMASDDGTNKMADYKRKFDLFDMDQSGFISIREIAAIMQTLSKKLGWENPVEEDELQLMVNEADADQNGLVSVLVAPDMIWCKCLLTDIVHVFFCRSTYASFWY